jgi:gluconate 2-dehydrogenase gamma chain
MDRRKSIKAMLIGGVSTGILVDACQTDKKSDLAKSPESVEAGNGINRMREEQAHDTELRSATYFTPHEMATIAILADVIIPKDEVSGSATDAKVPDFIEFIVKDMPEYQVPMRGGIRWIDMQCLTRFNNSFRDCTHDQQMQLVDDIAWPKKAKPEMAQGVSFFNLMRNLTATGFYTSAIGVRDVGYIGNMPNQWNGVPADVLKQYNMAYSEKELKECISF